MADRTLTGTYRLQLHAGFTFADAARVVPYLADLGVSHLYLSPILQAAPGSLHGYDVVDHSRVSTDLGGKAGLEVLAEHAHSHHLGLISDIVPNHMAIPEPEHLNRQLWDVLLHGRASTYASWFDVDWDRCGGRLGMPVLGASIDDVIAAGELVHDTVDLGSRNPGDDERQPVLRYHNHVFPVAAGTGDGDVAAVAARQHYLLGSWRDKRELLCHRRFFDVDTLIAIRVEDPAVFDASHAVLVDLHRRGILDGFRVDHPDGLADPKAYFGLLADATDGAWVVAEKILEGDERLPSQWSVAGTTGYDALSVIQTAVAPRTGNQLDAQWREIGDGTSLAETEIAAKRQVLDELLTPELDRLVRLATRAASDDGKPDTDPSRLEVALAELLVHVEVYRAYLQLDRPVPAESARRLEDLVEAARASRPELADELGLLRQLLADVDTRSEAGRDLVVRFQQVCGPVMAKGVEDTTFYRYNRMIALNEVGGDPGALDDVGPARLHVWAAYQQEHAPLGMTTLSTHDTKRSEDVRARLLAVAADADAWGAAWEPVRSVGRDHDVDEPTAYFLFQTLLGAWPISRDRLRPYVEKAVREAKRHTSWNDPDSEYEKRVHAFADACLVDEALGTSLERVITTHAAQIAAVTLSAKLLQLTLPGIPDVYQGCEAVSLSLVDPDNRRPVDFDRLSSVLVRLDQGPATPAQSDKPLREDKLLVTSRALRLRRDLPAPFGPGATYEPLSGSDNVVAFARTHGDEQVVTAVRFAAGETRVALPRGHWRDVLSDIRHDGEATSGAELFDRLPVALLVKDPVIR